MKNLQRVRAMIVLFVVMNGSHLLLAAAPIKLNAPLVAGGDASAVLISPDGSRVLYRADQDTDEVNEIFSVPITGGTLVKLNDPLALGGDVEGLSSGLQFSPDGSRVLYVADQDTDGVVEIYSVPSSGGTPVKLNDPLVANGNVDPLADNQFSPLSSRVLYLADQVTDGVNELFSNGLSTSDTPVKLNGTLVAGGNVDRNGLQFSPDGSLVLYLADQVTDTKNEIFSVPSGGGVAVKLSGALVANGDVGLGDFQFSPNGSRVIYLADQVTDTVDEIFSVPSGGGAAVKLNGALVAGGDVSSIGLQISPDSSRVLYVADQVTDGVNELFSVPITGGAPVKLNGPLVAGGDVVIPVSGASILFSPDSSRVAYRADQTTDEVFELFSVPSTGGTPVKLNGALVAGGDVSNEGILFSPDSNRVIYVADQITNGVAEIFSVSSGGGGTPVKLNGPLAVGGAVSTNCEFSPDGSRVLYIADQVSGGLGIYLVPSTGGTPVKVSGALVAGGSILSASESRFSPDGSVIVYSADQDTNDVFEIYARVVRLHASGAGSWDAGAVWDHGVAPDDVMQVFIDASTDVIASGTSVVRTVNELQVGGGPGTSMLTLAGDAEITVLNGLTIAAGGVVRGNGTLTAQLVGNNLGEVRSGAGEHLRLSSTFFDSEGRIEALGTAGNLAQLEFDGTVTNLGSTGLIAASHAILRFTGGLNNEGALAISLGDNHVFGDVNNTGIIVVSGGSTAVFEDDVDQKDTLRVSKVGSTTSTAVFLGAFTGSGGSTGGGDIIFEGDLSPGDSPGTVNFGSNIALGPGATLEIELGGTSPGTQYDQVNVTGSLSLDGTLAVSLINGFSPVAGNAFDILNWTSLSGTFDTLQLPTLGADLMWNESQLYTAGILSVALAGDFNLDGTVDAADYVAWRKGLVAPTPANYNLWRTNFGETAGGGSGADAAVPEPAAILMLAIGLSVLGALRLRRDPYLALATQVPADHSNQRRAGDWLILRSLRSKMCLSHSPEAILLDALNTRSTPTKRTTIMIQLNRAAGAFALIALLAITEARAAAPIKLNAPLPSGGGTGTVRISPDGTRVLYRADQDIDNEFEIFSVPITGGTPVQLNDPLVGTNADVDSSNLQFSPDGSRVLYVAGPIFGDEIYSVPSGGGTPVKLNGALVPGREVDASADNQFSPDGSRVLYLADQDTNGVDEIYSVVSTGGTPIKLNGPLVAGGDVGGSLHFSSDGSRVLYLADQVTDEVNEIFSVPSGGGAAVKLNGALVANGNVTAFSFRPDGTRVLYRADQTADEVFEIFTVPSGGGAAVKLNGALVANGDVTRLGPFSPDSTRVLYRADQTTDEVFELFSVPTGGGAPVKLNGPLVADGDVDFSDFEFSPDSSRVLYLADQTTDEVFEIFSVPSGGGTPVKLNGPLVAGGEVSSFQFSPDSSRVLYVASQDTDAVNELFSVASAGGTPVKLNGPLGFNGDVSASDVEFSPDGSRVLYVADQDNDGDFELFLVPSTGGTSVKVNSPVVAGGDLITASDSRFSPDGSVIVYTADQDTLNVVETYARIVRLHSLSGAGSWDTGTIWNHGVAPDEVMQVFINTATNVTASGTSFVRTANELQVGGGAGTSTLTLANDAGITVLNGLTIAVGGVVRGDGTIVAELVGNNLGEVRSAAGEQLRLSSTTFQNHGRVEASGTALKQAQIEFDGAVTNAASTGVIVGSHAVFRFSGGLTNQGSLTLNPGQNHVFGDIDNSGSVVVRSGAAAVFYDDVHQNGTLQVASSSSAVFLGAFTGSGGSTGGGTIFFEGDLRPGNSPATMSFGNDIALGTGTLEIELGGTSPGTQYDQVHVAGNLSLDGTLAVSLINDFDPVAGNSFDILDWGSLGGTFDTLQLPSLGADLMWNSSLLYTAGILSVALAGDFNVDGTVDAADYVAWRKGLGTIYTPADFNIWRAHFGQTAGAGATAASDTAVPEPLSISLLLLALVGVLAVPRGWVAAKNRC